MTLWFSQFLESAYSKISKGKVSCFLPEVHTSLTFLLHNLVSRMISTLVFLEKSQEWISNSGQRNLFQIPGRPCPEFEIHFGKSLLGIKSETLLRTVCDS